MYLAEELYLAITAPPPEEVERFAQLEADLADFVTSPTLDPQYLKSLWPPRDGIWAIRSVRPRPSIRVLGLFAAKDKFVATNFALRKELGEFDSHEWRTEKRRAKAIWRQLFLGYPYIPGRDLDKLFLGAINGKYFKK